MSRGRGGARYVKAPARGCLASGARGAAGTAARLTLGPGHRVRRGTGSRLGGQGRTAKCPQGPGSRLGLPTQRETQRHIRETSQVEGPRIFSSVSFPGMGEKSHEGDILQRAGESKHTMFRASVWAPFDQVSIYW